jgi:hypothetical protein
MVKEDSIIISFDLAYESEIALSYNSKATNQKHHYIVIGNNDYIQFQEKKYDELNAENHV